jgi:SAM-dependent methyltransferase
MSVGPAAPAVAHRSHAVGGDAGPECDLEIDPWADKAGLDAFDVVLFSEVIEHFNADPSHCLHEINRVLRDSGWLILTTVNVGSELGVYNLLNGEAPYAMSNLYGERGDRHQREWAPKELQRLVAAHGFETWVTTVNVYGAADVHHRAHRWLHGGGAKIDTRLHGDTNVVVARKVRASERPRRLHPMYHSVVAENARGHVPADVTSCSARGRRRPCRASTAGRPSRTRIDATFEERRPAVNRRAAVTTSGALGRCTGSRRGRPTGMSGWDVAEGRLLFGCGSVRISWDM